MIFNISKLFNVSLSCLLSGVMLFLLAGCGGSDSNSSNSTTNNAGDSSGCPGGSGSPTGSLVSYNLVPVGNAGNAADTTGFGSVSYTFSIGQYDTSIAQYTAFLNATAKVDPNGAYDTRMGTDLNIAGITRASTNNGYVYTVMNNGGDSSNRPIAYVNWFNAARFANWMSNGQPVGPQSSTTTENGAYDLTQSANGMAVAKNTCNPNTNKTVVYWIPTENEWYKAAYFSPNYNSTGSAGYYLYATQSNTAPGNLIGNAANQVNVNNNTLFSVTQVATLVASQNYLTDGGAFSSSPSYYGTFDQIGNLYQWNDLDGKPGAYRGVRGSMWFAGTQAAQATTYAASTPTFAGLDTPFRLAAMHE